MPPFTEHPDCPAAREWIASERERWEETLITWANQNSGSGNAEGNRQMRLLLSNAFTSLAERIQVLDTLPPAPDGQPETASEPPSSPALLISGSSKASPKVLLNGHMDTVYAADHPFQSCYRKDSHVLVGPGVADMKGGLVILLAALEAFTRSSVSDGLSWEALITADEETGSFGSIGLLQAAAARNDIGLAFEPSPPDGMIIRNRMGVGAVIAIAHGHAAHAGRNFDRGRNAIVLLSGFIQEAHRLNASQNGVICNVGRVSGGGPLNVVPDHAIAHFNVRAVDSQSADTLIASLNALANRLSKTDDCRIELKGGFSRPPKVATPETAALFERLRLTAQPLGHELAWADTGGASDGNFLQAAGLPIIDNLGGIGDNIHSNDEYLSLPSLVSRSQLLASFLINLAGRRFPNLP